MKLIIAVLVATSIGAATCRGNENINGKDGRFLVNLKFNYSTDFSVIHKTVFLFLKFYLKKV